MKKNPAVNKNRLKPLSHESFNVTIGSIYRHYKGLNYKILAIARHSETLEEMVVYQALYGDFGIWVRPLKMFLETVIINGQSQARFQKVD